MERKYFFRLAAWRFERTRCPLASIIINMGFPGHGHALPSRDAGVTRRHTGAARVADGSPALNRT